jgi:hypothetical protein
MGGGGGAGWKIREKEWSGGEMRTGWVGWPIVNRYTSTAGGQA